MPNYVLDRDSLDEFLDCLLDDKQSINLELNALIEECTYSTSFIFSNNYFFSKNIQRKIIKAVYPENYLHNVYNLQTDRAFFIEEFNRDFISFLISHISNLEIDLDSQLKEIQEDFVNSNYGKQIRY